jgi:Tfp pilus assembly protein PilF
MSLLLDALRTTQSSPPALAEPQDDALDGRETLKILTAENEANSDLTLESIQPSPAAVPAAASLDAAVPPRETAAASRNSAMTQGSAAAASSPTLSPALPPTLPRSAARRYAAMLAAAVAVVTVVMVGKSLLHTRSNPVIYPDAASPPASAGQPAIRPATSPVKVPSRPASQFSYAGAAPEIELHDAALPDAFRTPAHPVTKAGSADAPRTAVAATAAAAPKTRRDFSVTPSPGLSSIDQHIAAGYRALGAGNIASAQREYRSALELDPNNVDALLGTASAAARGGNPAMAGAAYAKVLRLEPGNKDATAALTILSRDPAAAEANESRLKVLIAADSERRPGLHTALAGVYAADARWTDAAQEYFIALSMDPGDSDLAFNVAASLDQNHNFAAALSYYAQALAFAKQRPGQIDVRAIEGRMRQLQARIEVRPAITRAAP